MMNNLRNLSSKYDRCAVMFGYRKIAASSKNDNSASDKNKHADELNIISFLNFPSMLIAIITLSNVLQRKRSIST
jgi:hypothetical protein